MFMYIDNSVKPRATSQEQILDKIFFKRQNMHYRAAGNIHLSLYVYDVYLFISSKLKCVENSYNLRKLLNHIFIPHMQCRSDLLDLIIS